VLIFLGERIIVLSTFFRYNFSKSEKLVASFEQHVNTALIATGILVVPLHASGLLSINESLVVLLMGVIGGVLPDLDSDNSKPIQIVFKMCSIMLPLIILLLAPFKISIVYTLAIWVGSAIFLHFTIFRTFLLLTSHRGVIHSIPMGFLFAQVTTLVYLELLNKELYFSLLAGFFIFFGFLIHLILDEIFSINALGLHVKRSFGTALKFYDKNNIAGSVVLYILIAITLFFIPIEKDLYLYIFNTIKEIKFL